MININSDYNQELKKKSEALYGYSLYISKVREYNGNGMSVKEAAIKALDYCIENDVLADFFRERRNEVVGMILEEYTLEHIEQRSARMSRKLEALTQEVQTAKTELKTTQSELQSTQFELQSAQSELQSAQSELQSAQSKLQTKDAEIARLRQLLAEK